MRSSQSHESNCRFDELTWLTHFFFSIFIIPCFIDHELGFIICFDLFFMRLFLSHDPSYKFSGLTRGRFFGFFFQLFFQFHPSILS
jgi:hypothetical protein